MTQMDRAQKVAVIGTGFISEARHLPAWRKAKRSRVVALSDLDEERAHEIAGRFRVPGVYNDVQTMLDEEAPDIVDVVTPPKTHASIAVQALKAGAHVLIEKPMAVTVDECDEIIETADAAGRQVCVVHSQLFYPPFIRARELVAGGTIGQFKGMRILLSTHVDYMTSSPDHWANKLPGGVIGETGPHAVYKTLSFINPIQDIGIRARKVTDEYPWSPYDDYRFDLIGDSATSSVTLSYSTNQWASQVDIWGTEGMLKVDLETKTLVKHRRRDLKPFTLGMSALGEAGQIVKGVVGAGAGVVTRRFDNTHDTLIKGFSNALANGEPPPVTAQEGREAVRVMKMIVERLNGAVS